MAKDHQTFERLLRASTFTTHGKLADALNVSPQVVQNWRIRGVSKDGALKAQAALGISAQYVLDGKEGPVTQRAERVETSLSFKQSRDIMETQLLKTFRALPAAKQDILLRTALQFMESLELREMSEPRQSGNRKVSRKTKVPQARGGISDKRNQSGRGKKSGDDPNP